VAGCKRKLTWEAGTAGKLVARCTCDQHPGRAVIETDAPQPEPKKMQEVKHEHDG
jgi:hypothetical protein